MFSRISNQYDMLDQLELEFKNRIENINKNELRQGYIHGTLDGILFCMTYKYDDYIILTSDDDSVLDDLQDFCTGILGEHPICSYDLVDEESHVSYPTMEWSVRNSSKRLSDLMSGKAYDSRFVLYNFRYRVDALDESDDEILAK